MEEARARLAKGGQNRCIFSAGRRHSGWSDHSTTYRIGRRWALVSTGPFGLVLRVTRGDPAPARQARYAARGDDVGEPLLVFRLLFVDRNDPCGDSNTLSCAGAIFVEKQHLDGKQRGTPRVYSTFVRPTAH